MSRPEGRTHREAEEAGNLSEKFREEAEVLGNRRIADGIFDLRLKTEHIAGRAEPGQFVTLICRDSARLLPRPISICEADFGSGQLRLVFRIAGKGTEEFSHLHPGEKVSVVGPLGSGFPARRAKGTVLLIGGGIGIPPLVQLAKTIHEETAKENPSGQRRDAQMPETKPHIISVPGYRSEMFLKNDLEKYGDVAVATEDGSFGTKGNVLDAVRENGLRPDIIYACGPAPMLKALKAYARERGVECWLSLEEKMACGIGACLSCVCRSAETDEHSRVKNKRVCTEGPVFRSEEVLL